MKKVNEEKKNLLKKVDSKVKTVIVGSGNTGRKIIHGWQPDLPDHRDLIFKPKVIKLPVSVDLRTSGFMPAVYDQGQLGSCTANGIGAAIEYMLKKEKLADFMPSRLFIYWNERKMEGTVTQDAGAQIRDGVKSVSKLGVCDEKEWTYTVSRFKLQPPQTAYVDALKNLVTKYERVTPDESNIKGALAAGFPVVFGFTCYESFESAVVATSGILPMPKPAEKVVGGHCVLCVGYDDSKKMFLIRNSWGAGWGLQGYFWMPYAYMTNGHLADDMWKIEVVK